MNIVSFYLDFNQNKRGEFIMAEKIKLGIVGLGRIGWGMAVGELNLYEDKYEVVAVCDLIEYRRNKANDKFVCVAYEDYA